MGIEYKEISKELLVQTEGNAWSMENMEMHGMGHRTVDYIGSRTAGSIVYDYYRDNVGEFWFKNRAIADGEIVSMECYIFGHEIRRNETSLIQAKKWLRHLQTSQPVIKGHT